MTAKTLFSAKGKRGDKYSLRKINKGYFVVMYRERYGSGLVSFLVYPDKDMSHSEKEAWEKVGYTLDEAINKFAEMTGVELERASK